MNYLVARDEKTNRIIGEWVMGKMGRAAVPPYRCIGGFDGEGKLVSGAVFNGYNGANVDLTSYAPGGVTRAGLQAIFHFAFAELNCTRVTARSHRKNRVMHGNDGVLIRLGFRFEGVAERWYGDGKRNDAFVYKMLRDDCRWIARDSQRGRTRGPRRQGNGNGASRDEQRDGHSAGRSQ